MPDNSHEFNLISGQLHAGIGSVVLENSSTLGILGAQLIRLSDNVTVEEAVFYYLENSSVLFAEPNYITFIPPPMPAAGIEEPDVYGNFIEGNLTKAKFAANNPDDPFFPSQWSLNKLQLPLAWDITTGSDAVIIAVLDTGIKYDHPDFNGNIWVNMNEIPNNGMDDDLNGYIDDVNGWDFANNDNSPFDDDGHGTGIASIIGSKSNNLNGMAGIMWNVRIMPVKIGDSSGVFVGNEIKGINYARNNGAKVIVCSFGNYQYKASEWMAIEQAPDLLFVCAAGNDGLDTDIFQHYPSGYSNLNIISVAATDKEDNLCSFSNYGQNTVDVGAPGTEIVTLSLDSKYYNAQGTSYAGPHAAGIAGLILAIDPGKNGSELRSMIMGNVDINQLNGYVRSAGRINAYKSLLAISTHIITASAGEGGTISPAGTVNVPAGSSLSFTIIPDPGYRISGVIVDGVDIGAAPAYTFNNIQANHAISASFTPAQYTISATTGQGGTISPAGSLQVSAGSSHIFTITPDQGYNVSSVVVDGVDLGPATTFSFQNIQANHAISASFTPAQYTITATAGQGGTINPTGSVQVSAGSSHTFTITPDQGYNVSSVVVDGVDLGPVTTYTFQNIQANHAISVSFTPTDSKYTITAIANQGGVISPAGAIPAPAGSSRTFTITANPGYRVSGLLVNGVDVGCVNIYTIPDIRSDYSVTACFELVSEQPENPVFSLEPGWNFISTPQALSEGYDTAGAVFQGIDTAGRSILTYDAQTGQWKRYYAESRIEPLTGIWVYSTQKAEIPLNIKNGNLVYTVSLSTGWNAIGCPDSSPVTARDALFSIRDSWSQVIGYDAQNQQYGVSIVNGGGGSHSDSNALIPTKGYWVYVRNPCVLL